MNKKVTGIGVDSGTIMVGDMDYLKTVKSDISGLGKEIKNIPVEGRFLGKIIKVPVGKYSVYWCIQKTSNGNISGVQTLEVTSGKVFVCDPCYIIGTEGTDWHEYLEKTNYMEDLKTNLAFIINEMGGDGEYVVELSFDKIP